MPYLSALEVFSRRGAISVHVYLYLYLRSNNNNDDDDSNNVHISMHRKVTSQAVNDTEDMRIVISGILCNANRKSHMCDIHYVQKKETKMFCVISPIKLG